ncbi:MAG: hypothetical protein R6V00_00405 [Candidatus Aminicenantes bacterium]
MGLKTSEHIGMIAVDPRDSNAVYAAFNNHKNGDFKPYVLKSTDAGKTLGNTSLPAKDKKALVEFQRKVHICSHSNPKR